MHRLRSCFTMSFLLALLGCETKLSAPALTDDLVYENSAGMRFVVPERWAVTAKSNIPNTIPAHPTRLVAYRSPTNLEATLDVYVAPVPNPTQSRLNDYLSEHPIGPRRWALEGSFEELKIGNTFATRTIYTARNAKKQSVRREIVLFNQNALSYFFVLEYGSDDTASREQARRAIESTVWN